MGWLEYQLYGNISCESKPLFQYTPLGQANLERIERQVAAFYRENESRIPAMFLFRFWKDSNEWTPADDHASIPDRHYGEMIRLRFCVAEGDEQWALRAFGERVIAPLQLAFDDGRACLMGWRRFDGYSARNDLGARYGDLAHGIDPTEEIVSILTAWTRYRFFLLEHPELNPKHDLINLCFNTIGLTYPDEVRVLQQQEDDLQRHIRSTIGF